jgi:hypothetical protein
VVDSGAGQKLQEDEAADEQAAAAATDASVALEKQAEQLRAAAAAAAEKAAAAASEAAQAAHRVSAGLSGGQQGGADEGPSFEAAGFEEAVQQLKGRGNDEYRAGERSGGCWLLQCVCVVNALGLQHDQLSDPINTRMLTRRQLRRRRPPVQARPRVGARLVCNMEQPRPDPPEGASPCSALRCFASVGVGCTIPQHGTCYC